MADADATSEATPSWLNEGFADYVGNLNSGQPVGVAAAELRAQVRAHGAPVALPADTDFESASTAAAAYEGSWLACRLIAARIGQGGLVRFYRAVGSSGAAGDEAVRDALRSLLHLTPAEFAAQWRAYVSGQLR